MIAALALALSGVIGAGADNAIALLNHSAWTDIGPGRRYAQMKPAEIARLRKCDAISMYFEHWDGRPFDQVFETALSMRFSFERVDLAKSGTMKVITLYRAANAARPNATLYLTNDDTVLTQVIPPASPHVFVRCVVKSKQPENR